MNIVEFNKEKHYDRMCKLWEEYGWLPCPIDALPKHGRVAEDNGKFVAFLAIYIEQGTIAVMDWALADRSYDDTHTALQLLFDTLVKLAKDHGCHYIYSFTKNVRWGDRLESYGMLPAERGATSYIMPIGENKETTFIGDY